MWVCGRLLYGIAGSNPVCGMNVCILTVLCLVRWRSLRRADHSSWGVLEIVKCISLSVISKSQRQRGRGEERWGEERRGSQAHKRLSSYEKNYSYLHPCCGGGGNDDDCDDNTAKPLNLSYTSKIRAHTYSSCQSCCKIFSEELDTADRLILTAVIDLIFGR